MRGMFPAHMLNEKISEELLAETRTLKKAYEYAIRRANGIEHNRTIKSHSLGLSQTSGSIKLKQEPIDFINQQK